MARELRFAFPLPNGLHARPAALLSEVARRFASTLTLANRRNGCAGNAKSTLALVATLTRHGDPCTLTVEGGDEPEAYRAMQACVAEELSRCDVTPAPPRPVAAGDRPLPRALRTEAAHVHLGTAAAPGLGMGPAFVLDPCLPGRGGPVGTTGSAEQERAKAERALGRVAEELRAALTGSGNPTLRAIVGAHLAIVEDPELAKRILEGINSGLGAGEAVLATADHFAGILRASGTAYLEERADDLRDLAARLLRTLDPDWDRRGAFALTDDAVCVAASLAPSQLLSLGNTRLRGLALGQAGTTSHTVILARALGIPAVIGLAGIERKLTAGREVIVDGQRGLVVVEPSAEVRRFYERESAKLGTFRCRTERFKTAPGRTADGRRLEIAANVGSPEEARLAFENGADGIGLFRTELLFMSREQPPSEEDQTRVYRETAEIAGPRPVVIRTLDVGGDKLLPYLDLPREANPFLGFRAVRIYGEHDDLIAAQVRAILRASAAGDVRLMFPMVSSLDEVRALRALVERCMRELAGRGIAYNPAIEVGVMVEVPALALIAGRVAAEVEFLSVGSNDLAQYVFAVDRGNDKVAHLANPLHPGFLRLLKDVVDGAHAAGRPVAICGELGGATLAAPLLVGLGFDELSLAPPGMPAMKAAVAACDPAECGALLAAALAADTAKDVESLLRGRVPTGSDGLLVTAETIVPRSASRTKGEAIRELVDLLHVAGRVDDPDRVEDAVWRREDVASTGVGFGVAIPHCTSADVLATSLAMVRCKPPIEWGGDDAGPVALAILVAVRGDAPADAHLRMIAALSRRLMDDGFRRSLLDAPGVDEVVALLTGATAVG